MADEITQEKPIENETTIEEKKEPIHKIVIGEVAHFIDKNGYSSLAIGVGLIAGIFLYVKYKRKK